MKNTKLEELYLDDGEVRRCSANMAKLGFWANYRLFHGYKRCWGVIDWDEVIDGAKQVLSAIAYISLIPVMPFIQCFFQRRSAIKEVAEEQRNRNETI